jgi:hypothetical protein
MRMSSKNDDGTPGKGNGAAEEGVLGNLPSTRPTRFGRERTSAAKPRTTTAKPRATAAKPAAKAKPRATATRASSPKPTAARARPKAKAPERPASPKPRAVRSGSPSLKQPASRGRRPQVSSPPKGVELVTTAAQAAGELTQIGLTLGRQFVKRTVGRLPKP